jgi:hypothetical protein
MFGLQTKSLIVGALVGYAVAVYLPKVMSR